jgi:quercetin dioxygenase-like cupin family protein
MVLGQPFIPRRLGESHVGHITMQPGEQTGWHQHDVPMFCYMLEGEITVDYGKSGTRTYRKGDALMEAIDVVHDGRNRERSPHPRCSGAERRHGDGARRLQ